MWLDELQAWMIARDSDGLVQLFTNLRYEGHPALWHLMLYPIARIFAFPEAMQWLHVTIAAGSIYILVRYAPFPTTIKILLSLSYFLFYEYSQLARNYAPGVFLAFAFCAAFPVRRSHPVFIAAIIFLLAQTSVYGAIMAIALAVTLLFERVMEERSLSSLTRLSGPGMAAAIIIGLGITLALMQMRQPADSVFPVNWYIEPDLGRFALTIRALVGGYFPVPKFQINFWNSHILHPLIVAPAVIYAMAVFALAMRNKPSALLAYGLMTVGCLIFLYMKYPGSIRHHGFLFMALVISLWIAPACTSWREQDPAEEAQTARLTNWLFGFLLLLQVSASAIAVYHDYRSTFSGAREAADFLSRHARADDVIAGASSQSVAVSGYLNRPIYHIETGRYETFAIWDNSWRGMAWVNDPRKFRIAIPIPLLEKLNRSNKLFIISHRPLMIRSPGVSIQEVFSSTDTIERNGDVIIYEVTR